MLTVEITNDGTGTNAVGNYDYRVLVNGRVIDEGRVESHMRIDGWAELLRKVARRGEDNNLCRLAEGLEAFAGEVSR